MGPGWVSRAVEGVQKWLADGEEGVRFGVMAQHYVSEGVYAKHILPTLI